MQPAHLISFSLYLSYLGVALDLTKATISHIHHANTQKAKSSVYIATMVGYQVCYIHIISWSTQRNSSLPEFLLGSPRLALRTVLVLMLETAKKGKEYF